VSKTLIIDANSIGYAAHHATTLTVGDLQTQAIFGFIKMMREFKGAYRGYKPMVLWDGKSQWRHDLLPAYKSSRDNDPIKKLDRDAYREQRPYIAKALHCLGVRQMTVTTHEADDMAGLLVAQLTQKPGNEIELITGDRDWIQLVRPGVVWRDNRDESKVVRIDTLTDKTGYLTPYGFLEGKCLQGDNSDDIPPVGGIGKAGAPEFIAKFGSVRKFWQQCDAGTFKPKTVAHIGLCSAAGRMKFGVNLRLMQLLRVTPPAKEAVQLDVGAFNQDEFVALCEELHFVSILKNIDSFCNTFKE